MRIQDEQELKERAGNGLVAMPMEFVGRFRNGGCTDPCDMIIGPCACGASHHIRDWPEWFIAILLREKLSERARKAGAECSRCGGRGFRRQTVIQNGHSSLVPYPCPECNKEETEVDNHMQHSHDWQTDTEHWPCWPGNIRCSCCGVTASAACDFLDTDAVVLFLEKQNQRTDCSVGEEMTCGP